MPTFDSGTLLQLDSQGFTKHYRLPLASAHHQFLLLMVIICLLSCVWVCGCNLSFSMIAIFSVNHWKLRSTISRNNWLPLQAIADQAYWELLAEEEAKLTPEEDSGVIFGQWGGTGFWGNLCSCSSSCPSILLLYYHYYYLLLQSLVIYHIIVVLPLLFLLLLRLSSSSPSSSSSSLLVVVCCCCGCCCCCCQLFLS